MSKNIVIITTIIAVALVTLGGAAVYIELKNQKEAQEGMRQTATPTATLPQAPEKPALQPAEPAPTPEPITQPEIDTSDWKTYRNEKYGFEVRYPQRWLINERDGGVDIVFPNPQLIKNERGEYSGVPYYAIIRILRKEDFNFDELLRSKGQVKPCTFRDQRGVTGPLSRQLINQYVVLCDSEGGSETHNVLFFKDSITYVISLLSDFRFNTSESSKIKYWSPALRETLSYIEKVYWSSVKTWSIL